MLTWFEIIQIQKTKSLLEWPVNLISLFSGLFSKLMLWSISNGKKLDLHCNVRKNPFQNSDFYLRLVPNIKAISNNSYINFINSLTCEKLLRLKYFSTSVASVKLKRTSKFSKSWNIETDLLVLHFLMFIFCEKILWGLDIVLALTFWWCF